MGPMIIPDIRYLGNPRLMVDNSYKYLLIHHFIKVYDHRLERSSSRTGYGKKYLFILLLYQLHPSILKGSSRDFEGSKRMSHFEGFRGQGARGCIILRASTRDEVLAFHSDFAVFIMERRRIPRNKPLFKSLPAGRPA